MDPIYYFIIGLILVLSCFDLGVGVSNDAANFLNSAVGSKAAPRRTIILVAALGIIIGSLFSSGMMEIARSGVFMPAQFTFHDIMLIFLAVMLTDVILLDVFNTFGLPTSTTVSIVFELLGGAVAVALFKIWSAEPGAAQELSSYINSSKALAIISGIFSSVFVAFICGITVMWISRLIFSFNYKKSFKYLGAVWCGLALTAITYFAIFKGLKGSTLVTKDMIRPLDAHIPYDAVGPHIAGGAGDQHHAVQRGGAAEPQQHQIGLLDEVRQNGFQSIPHGCFVPPGAKFDRCSIPQRKRGVNAGNLFLQTVQNMVY